MKIPTYLKNRATTAAYSLVEVLAASGIVAMGVGAAVALSFATTSQEETAHRAARALSIQENAARLFELGLSSNEVLRLLPPDPVVSAIAITESAPTVALGVQVQQADIDVAFETSPSGATWSAGTWTGGPGGSNSVRTLSDLIVIRPSTRAGYN